MSVWRPQQYIKAAKRAGVRPVVRRRAAKTASKTARVNPDLHPLLTLRHLAHLTRVSYGFLRAVVTRKNTDPYRVFAIKKSRSEPKQSAYRIICVPNPDLMRAQRWISKRILAHGRPHGASYAYAPGSSVKDAASLHCGCTWLIKLDVCRFFESISEIAAYSAFLKLGYQPLVAFELSRICTRQGNASPARGGKQWLANTRFRTGIPAYLQRYIGHIPQGAPTSPMLSNLAMFGFDQRVSRIARHYKLDYTRYADDLCLSTPNSGFGRAKAAQVIGEVYAAMGQFGLSPNRTKTKVSPPGSRKIVLGLLVDGEKPRLTREFRANLRRHVHYLLRDDVGPVQHARARGFTSVLGLRNHIEGLVSFARQIDGCYADKCARQLAAVRWPF